MDLHKLFTVEIQADQEDLAVLGNAMASGDDVFDREVEDAIIERLDKGDIWAWASVSVRVSIVVDDEEFEAFDFLGCCSYHSEEDFRNNSGYFDDMCHTCLADLGRRIKSLKQALKAIKE